MSVSKIRAEIDDDPLVRGYAGMTDQQVADDLNTAYRSRLRSSMSGDEIFQATDETEFSNLAANSRKQDMWVSFCGRSAIDPTATANVAFVEWIFGNPSTTRSNLIAARSETITRAEELKLGNVTAVSVEQARAL